MKENLFHVLTNIGLEKKEAQIYLALVELGEATVLEISRESGVNRASIYYILEKMKKRGLVTLIEKKGSEFYCAVEPHLLLAQEKSKIKDFERSIPELTALINQSGERPRVRFFEGIDGIKAIYADTLTSKTDILNYANSREIRDHWPEYDTQYVAKRAEKKIHLRGIAPDDDYGQRVRSEDSKYAREIRLIHPKKISISNEINIYDHKIAMVSFNNPIFGIVIESKPMADTQRCIFEMAWSFASRPRNTEHRTQKTGNS